MKPAALILLAASLAAQQPARRAIAPSPSDGWARVVVDDDGADGIWIGDADGRSVPFLWESDANWSSIPLVVTHPVWGKDAKEHPTGAFTLAPPQGFLRGDREQVALTFSLQAASSPWVCEVKVERRDDKGAFIAQDDVPRFICDLGEDHRVTSITIPWDGDEYRVTLEAKQGRAPKLLGLSASACTVNGDLKADEVLPITFRFAGKNQDFGGMALADLGGNRNLVGLDVVLQPPAAAVWVDVVVSRRGYGESYFQRVIGGRELWNLPALNTTSAHIPLSTNEHMLCLNLPQSVGIQSAAAFIRHRRLFFPAEAGKAYFLHEGGLAKMAPGSLGALPASSRTFYAGAPLALGAAEADPQAVQAAPDPAAKLRRWLPWGVGALVLLLGFWGLRLLKAPKD